MFFPGTWFAPAYCSRTSSHRPTARRATSPTTFRWTLAEGARPYQLEVSTDPDFWTLVEEVDRLDLVHEHYPYPANKTLYWRVRAEWRALPPTSPSPGRRRAVPEAAPDAGAGSGQPDRRRAHPDVELELGAGRGLLRLHAEESDGDQQTFSNFPSHAFTPTAMTGLGMFHLKVRANFPTETGPTVDGPYSPLMSFARTMPEPNGPTSTVSPNHLLLSWLARAGAESSACRSRPGRTSARPSRR